MYELQSMNSIIWTVSIGRHTANFEDRNANTRQAWRVFNEDSSVAMANHSGLSIMVLALDAAVSG